MKKIIGIAGSSGAGKSTFCAFLKELSITIIDADKIGKDILKPNSEALKKVSQVFGEDILLTDGSLNRKKLGKIVFHNEAELQNLNSITKELIEKEIRKEINAATDGIIGIDCAMLLHSKLKELCDEIVYVTAGEEKQIERIMKRDGLSYEDAKARISSQEMDYRSGSTIIIENNHDLIYLKEKAVELYRRLNND